MLLWTSSLQSVDWECLSSLYQIAGLGNHKSPDVLRTVFSNSLYRYFGYDDGVLVGAGRVLADGALVAYVCDIALLPEYQGRGLGQILMERILADCRGYPKIILYSVPDKINFYRRFGFRPMNTAMAVFENPAEATEAGYLGE